MKQKLITDSEIKDFAEEEGLLETDDISIAFYLLRDGTLLDGTDGEPGGFRAEDHRIMEGLIPNSEKYTDSAKLWCDLHAMTGMVRLIPETQIALIDKNQRLTSEQEEKLSESDYTVEKY